MRAIMDRLYACQTEIDIVIRRQRRALATVDAMQNMHQLETARKHIRAATIALVDVEGDALPSEASPMQKETPAPPPGQRQP